LLFTFVKKGRRRKELALIFRFRHALQEFRSRRRGKGALRSLSSFAEEETKRGRRGKERKGLKKQTKRPKADSK